MNIYVKLVKFNMYLSFILLMKEIFEASLNELILNLPFKEPNKNAFM